MRRSLLWLFGALGIAAILGWWFWPPRAAVEPDVDAVAWGLEQPNGPSPVVPGMAGAGGGSAAGSGFALSDDDVEYLNQAQVILRDVRLPQGQRTRLPDDELTREIFTKAAERGLRPEQGSDGSRAQAAARDRLKRSSLGERLPESLSAEERLAVVRQVEAGVNEITERIALARADRALEKSLNAEADLTVIHRDLVRLSQGKASVPDDPFGLLSPKQLQSVIESTKTDYRSLKERVALFPTPEVKLRLRAVEQLLERYQTLLGDPRYTGFHTDGKGFNELNKHISKRHWQAAQVEHQAHASTELKRLRAQASTIPSQQETLRVAHQVRGPPSDGLGKVLFEAARFYDADAALGVRSEARIQALQDAIMRSDLPPNHPARQLRGRARVLAFVDAESLHHLDRLLHSQELAAREAVAAGVANQERLVFMRDLADAVKQEVQRREAADSWKPVADSGVERLVQEHVGKGDVPLTDAVKAKYLAVAQERFPNVGTMPKTVADTVRGLLARSTASHIDRLERAVAQYRAVIERVGQSTEAIDAGTARSIRSQKESLQRATGAVHDYVREAEAKGVVVDPARKRKLLLVESLFRGPGTDPFDPGDPPAGAPSPEKPKGPDKPPPGGRRLLSTDPQFERHLAEAESHGRNLLPLARVNTEAPTFGKETGRYSVTEKDLTPGFAFDKKFRPDTTKPRLPGMYSEWKGRLTPDGKPYDFHKDVKNFRAFDPVGGGIHFGETAKWKGDRDLSLSVLRYDAGRKQLLLVGPGEKEMFRLEGVEPDVLKALYRFVLAKRNAAISIGWGLDRPTFLERQAMGGASTVLLDPYLVDTRIGQDLVLADTIPWEFDTKPLSGGKPTSFHEAFKKASDEFYRNCGKELKPIMARAKPFDKDHAGRWFERLSGDRSAPGIVLALLKHESIEEAMTWYASHRARALFQADLNAALRKEKLTEIDGASEEQLKEGLRRFREKLHLSAARVESREDLTPAGREKLDEILTEEVPRIYEELHTKIVAELKEKEVPGIFQLLGKDREEALQRAVEFTIDLQMTRSGVSEAMVELWAANLLKRVPKDKQEGAHEQLANYLAARQTSLAVLIDDPTTVELDGDKLQLHGRMRYRYATTRIVVKDGRVYFGKSPDEDNEVETIEMLTRLANDHWEEIVEGFAPLARVAEYGKLAAFLRWAVDAKEAGKLGGIDFSALATVPAYDRKRFPTPDEIRRGGAAEDQTKPEKSDSDD